TIFDDAHVTTLGGDKDPSVRRDRHGRSTSDVVRDQGFAEAGRKDGRRDPIFQRLQPQLGRLRTPRLLSSTHCEQLLSQEKRWYGGRSGSRQRCSRPSAQATFNTIFLGVPRNRESPGPRVFA